MQGIGAPTPTPPYPPYPPQPRYPPLPPLYPPHPVIDPPTPATPPTQTRVLGLAFVQQIAPFGSWCYPLPPPPPPRFTEARALHNFMGFCRAGCDALRTMR